MADKYVPRQIGKTGLRYTQSTLLDDEQAAEIRWPRSLTTFDKMKSDPIVSGSLFLIKQYIRKVEWDIKPYGDLEATDEDKRKADIVRYSLFKNLERSFDEVIADILSFIDYGFSFHEPTYKIYKGNIVWKDFPARSQKTITGWKFDDRGYLKSVEQTYINSASVTGSVKSKVEIPYNRLLHFRTDAERNNPLGRSILKNAYQSWYMKRKAEYLEGVGLERDLGGLPLLKLPAEYFAADPTEDPEKYEIFMNFVKVVENARNNEQAGIIIPSDVDESGKPLFDFQLLSSNAPSRIDASKVIERYDYRVAQSMLSDFLLMGSTSTGSYALSNDKVGTFLQSLEAYLEIISEQFNRKAIKQLYERNGWDSENTCELVHEKIGKDSLKDLGEFLDRASNYITTDATLENAIRKRADLPERDVQNQYLEVPSVVHQAQSQRLAMEAAAARSGVSQTSVDEDDNEIEKALNKAIEGAYQGES
jgi:hypothetical protein